MEQKYLVVAYSTKVLKFKQITTVGAARGMLVKVVAYSTKVLKFKQITTAVNDFCFPL